MSTDLERFTSSDGRAEAVERVRAEIDAKGVTYIYYQFVSVTGRIMGKGVPADHWERIADRGFQLVYGSTANLFTDRHGQYIGYGPEAWELVERGLVTADDFRAFTFENALRLWGRPLFDETSVRGAGISST